MKQLLLSLLLLATPAFAQPTDCDSIVIDNAHVLSGGLSDSIAALVKTGAEVRVVTDTQTIPMEFYKDHYVGRCSSWQSGSGRMKGNLIVFMVFPNAGKMGLFYGSEWAPALDPSVELIKSQYMGPAFHAKDFSRGFQGGIVQVTNQITAFQSKLGPPPAADYSGLWKILAWLLILAVLAAIVYALIRWRYHFLERRDAQLAAIDTRNQVARSLRALDANLSAREALGEDVKARREIYNAAMDDFATASNNEKTNPSAEGLSAAGYEAIQSEYSRILRGISVQPQAFDPSPSSTPASPHKRHSRSGGGTTVTQAASPVQTTTVFYNDSGYMPVPVFVEERTYVEPAYVAPEPSPSSSWDSDGGSSGSYDSGSYDDSGSSSSFDSGGFDSGGSSSDF